jgi:hypothetical protein
MTISLRLIHGGSQYVETDADPNGARWDFVADLGDGSKGLVSDDAPPRGAIIEGNDTILEATLVADGFTQNGWTYSQGAWTEQPLDGPFAVTITRADGKALLAALTQQTTVAEPISYRIAGAIVQALSTS